MNNSRVKLSYAAKCAMAFSGLILSSCAADEVEVEIGRASCRERV